MSESRERLLYSCCRARMEAVDKWMAKRHLPHSLRHRIGQHYQEVRRPTDASHLILYVEVVMLPPACRPLSQPKPLILLEYKLTEVPWK